MFSKLKNLKKKEKQVAKEIDSIREFYDDIILEEYYEPQMVWEIDNTKKNDKMTLIIAEPDDINCWIQGLSQGCIVKMRHLEEAIGRLMDVGDLYSSAILIRHHLELSGLLCLSLEILVEHDKDKLQRFISKTSYGAAYYNNPKLRDSNDAFFRTETPTVSAMIGALDKFLQDHTESAFDENFFKHNYAFLCQFSHPSTDTSTFFVDATLEGEGHIMQFNWEPNFGKIGTISTLHVLKQSLQVGLACYFLFTAYHFTQDKVYVNETNIEKSFEIFTGNKPER
ncbi:hypothetical protein [Paenibacillus sp. M-152]|uniref:hypothetical protein n=1 Tax=Paenibacillus sp. M-152 TaxID=2487928 RepID=UPI000F6B9E71|nr:hypothetical protein [Paenibacillus sp. M-152]AZH30498.1 hypothetical protein EGM68_17845 [Paenibacillus sp. M-152]